MSTNSLTQNQNLVSVIGDQAVTTSLAIAEGTEVEHKAVIQLIRTYVSDLKEFGRVTFEMRPFETTGGIQNREIALLNEQQSTLILTYMRNSEIVRGFKKRLVRAFWELAQNAKPAFPVPQTFPEALRLAATLAEAKEALEAKIEADAPKVEFHAEVTADSTTTYLIRDAAKILEKKESELRGILRSRRLIFQCRDGHWEPYAEYIRRGWLALKIETINGHVIKFPVITGKGITAIRDRLARDDPSKHSDIPQTRNAIACNASGSMVSR